MRQCTKCQIEKPASEYYTRQRTGRSGVVRTVINMPCKECARAQKRKVRTCLACGEEWEHRGKSGGRTRFCPTCVSEWRVCTICERVQDRSAFYEHNPYCKPCARAYNRHRLYGLTPGDYEQMVKDRAGKCDACSRDDRPLVVDHHHGSGAVRGLLCDGCNKGLGCFRDDVDALAGAMAYLVQHEADVLAGKG